MAPLVAAYGGVAPPRRRSSAASAILTVAIRGLTLVAPALLYLVSDMALTRFGFNYGGTGGSVVEKIHPGTWLALAALGLTGVSLGNPLRLGGVVFAQPGLAFFLATWVLLLAYVLIVTKVPFTPLIDTFLLPMIIFLLLSRARDVDLRRLALTLHVILTCNAVIGLAEYVTGWRLTPYTIGALQMDGDWRSTALLGHPLANASVTGSYIVALAVGGGRDLPRLLRPVLIGLQMVAMTAFGGRSSLVTAMIIVAGVLVFRAGAIVRGRRFDPLMAAGALLMAPVAILAAVLAFRSGFFDLFVDRFSNDAGSAKSRIYMLNLFGYLTPTDLLFGPSQTYLSSLQEIEGIEFGIECFWVAFILTHGIAVSVFFFSGLFAFTAELVAATRAATVALLIFFYIVASTSVSLSAKTCAFGMFVSMVMCMMRPRRPAHA